MSTSNEELIQKIKELEEAENARREKESIKKAVILALKAKEEEDLESFQKSEKDRINKKRIKIVAQVSCAFTLSLTFLVCNLYSSQTKPQNPPITGSTRVEAPNVNIPPSKEISFSKTPKKLQVSNNEEAIRKTILLNRNSQIEVEKEKQKTITLNKNSQIEVEIEKQETAKIQNQLPQQQDDTTKTVLLPYKKNLKENVLLSVDAIIYKLLKYTPSDSENKNRANAIRICYKIKDGYIFDNLLSQLEKIITAIETEKEKYPQKKHKKRNELDNILNNANDLRQKIKGFS